MNAVKHQVAVVACTLMLSGVEDAAAQVGFQGLGGPSTAEDISSDGATVVGELATLSGRVGFRWTQAEGMVSLGDFEGGDENCIAFDLSAEGTTIVGWGSSAAGVTSFGPSVEAFRWTPAEGLVSIGEPATYLYSSAAGVSADGSVIVGVRYASIFSQSEAFRWTAGLGLQGLGDLPGGDVASHAYGISDDGTVIVGWGTSELGTEAFRWDSSGMQGLGDLPGGAFYSIAWAASADGTIIVGEGRTGSGFGGDAFRWEGGEMTALGVLPGGSFSAATAISPDGSVIVGHGDAPECLNNNGSACAVLIWQNGGGPRSLKDVLQDDFGLDLTGWVLDYAGGVAADNRTIVGRGTNPAGQSEAFLARLGNTTAGANATSELNGGASSPHGAAITFSNVTLGGETSLTSSDTAPALPTGFQLGDPATFYDLSTTASFTGEAQVCLNYTGITYADESTLKLLHYENDNWLDVTTSLDTEANIICGSVTSFSPFAIVESDSDTDDDGIANGDDLCPSSNQSPTIIVNGEDTGVANDLLPSGCTLVDLVTALLATNPSTNQVVQFLVQLKGQGVISGQELGAILQALNGP